MMRPTTARRRAEQFAEALEGRAADGARHVPAKGSAAEYAAFVALVEQLRDLEPPPMRPAFADDLRARLMAAAPEALTGAEPTSAGRRSASTREAEDAAIVSFPRRTRGRRSLTVAAAACIVLGSGVGVAAASQSALPGQALYPVKRGIEHVEVTFAGSQQAKGHELLDQAGTRLNEVTNLAVAHPDDPSTPILISRTLDSFSSQAQDGADKLMTAYRQDGSRSSIGDLRTFADDSARRLDALTLSIPPAADQALTKAASTLRELDQQAQGLCPTCSSLPSLQLSSSLISLQQHVTDTWGTTPGTSSTTGPDATASPSHPGAKQSPQPSQGFDTPTLPAIPALPQVTTAPAPTSGSDDNTTSGTSSSQPSTTTSGGVSVTVPGTGLTVGTSLPSVPLPTVDLNDPLGSVVDGASSILDLP